MKRELELNAFVYCRLSCGECDETLTDTTPDGVIQEATGLLWTVIDGELLCWNCWSEDGLPKTPTSKAID